MTSDSNTQRMLATAAIWLSLTATALSAPPDTAREKSAESSGVARSTGNFADQRPAGDEPLELSEPAPETLTQKTRPDNATTQDYQPSMTASAKSAYFRIYDAGTTLIYDDDGDGHYHYFRVTFDADTDYVAADVYARLYLSLEGGPWLEYFITDIFTLVSTSGADDYEVTTELVSGYPTGYYDLLIELYDADYDEHVASFGPFESSALSFLPLEDLEHDVAIVVPPGPAISHSSGGGGSSGILVLGLLLMVLAGRYRVLHQRGFCLADRRGRPGADHRFDHGGERNREKDAPETPYAPEQ